MFKGDGLKPAELATKKQALFVRLFKLAAAHWRQWKAAACQDACAWCIELNISFDSANSLGRSSTFVLSRTASLSRKTLTANVSDFKPW